VQVVARFGILCHYFPLQSPLEFISHLIEMVREYVYIPALQRWEGCGVTKSIPCTLVGRKCKEKVNGDAARMEGFYILSYL
jgi:hypothetical protein